MHLSRVTFAILSLVLYVASGVRAEEPGLKLRMQRELIPYSLGRDEPTNLFLDADNIQGHQDQELDAVGSVRLRKRGAAVFSDQLHLSFPDQQLTATGHVRFEKEGDVVTGEQLFYDLYNNSGYVAKPQYSLPQYGAQGTENRMSSDNRDIYRISKSHYTNTDHWY